MCAFDATMAMALSRRVFLTLYYPMDLPDNQEIPIIVTIENPIVATMSRLWPTIASQGCATRRPRTVILWVSHSLILRVVYLFVFLFSFQLLDHVDSVRSRLEQ